MVRRALGAMSGSVRSGGDGTAATPAGGALVSLVYSAAIATSITAFRLFSWDVRVAGVEHVPSTGGGIIATNHVGYLDFVFAGYGALQQGRRARFVAKREVFDHPVAGPLMRSMGHIAVDRGGNTATAMREVAAALEGGDLVGMFPEGTVSTSFVPLAGRSGAARMAMAAGVPLIPGAVWGTQRISTKGRKPSAARRTVVTVTFGPPIEYAPDDAPAAVHQRLMAAIRSLVDEAQRSYPQQPGGPDDAWWQPAHLGGSAPTAEQAEQRALADREARRRRS
jgi:1-acyl-sn-glycerol-3-phosphate acyltransferase